jgi:chemotaxis response regulator CheB
VLVTIHVGEQTRLPQILSRSGPLRATLARDDEELEQGHIYIAPRGRHLIVRGDRGFLSPDPASTAIGRQSMSCSPVPPSG